MQNIINCQMSVFGEYAVIEPTLERMNLLAALPPELGITLLPSTTNVINLNTLTPQGGINPPSVLQRICMVDTSQHWNISILPERIDVNFNQLSDENAKPFTEISHRAYSLLKKTVNDLDVNYNRMAVNCTMQYDDEDDRKSSGLHDMLTRPMQHQIDRKSVEWQVMSNCPQEIELTDSHKEVLNFISVIERQFNLMAPWPFIMVRLDINTSAQNREFRFNDSKLEVFCNAAVDMANSFIEEVKEKWSNA